MKKAALLFSILLLLAARSFAQVPLIALGTIPANTMMGGKTVTVTTTSAEIIKNATLTGNDAHCVITGYTFSIVKGDMTWSTNAKGDKLTPAIIRKIKKTKGPGVKIYFDNIQILYDGEKASTNPVLLEYDQ